MSVCRAASLRPHIDPLEYHANLPLSPGGHYWHYQPGTPPSLSSHRNSFEDRTPVHDKEVPDLQIKSVHISTSWEHRGMVSLTLKLLDIFFQKVILFAGVVDYKWDFFMNMVQYNEDQDDVIKWKYFPHYWPFVRGIHQSPVNSPHKGQWRRVLLFSLIWAWPSGRVNNRDAGDLRRHRPHYDVIAMSMQHFGYCWPALGLQPCDNFNVFLLKM